MLPISDLPIFALILSSTELIDTNQNSAQLCELIREPLRETTDHTSTNRER